MLDVFHWFVAALSLSAVALLVGLGGGWLFARRDSTRHKEHEQRLRQLFERLHDLARSVAEDVDAHCLRLDEISAELADHDLQDPAAGLIVETVAQIVDANKLLHGKLTHAEQRLEEQAAKIDFHLAEARVDSLTGLANRRAFDDELARRFAEWERTQIPFSLLLLDIDHFKSCNDRYGHLAGDEVLRGVGGVLADTLRQMDFVARYGGEEFAAILPSTGLMDACTAAERVREILANVDIRLEETSLQVTVSVGVADVLARDNPRLLFKRCDAALYAAKSNGRNCSYYHDAAGPERVVASPEPATSETRGADDDWTAEDQPEPKAADENVELVSRRTFVELFHDHLLEARRVGRPLSLLLMHVGRLHKLNSWGGAPAAERAMQAISEVLLGALRTSDLFGRYGWDQFAVVLPGMDVEHASQIESRLHEALAASKLPLGSGPRLVVFTGLAELWPDDDLASFTRRAADDLEEVRATPESGTRLRNESAPQSIEAEVPVAVS